MNTGGPSAASTDSDGGSSVDEIERVEVPTSWSPPCSAPRATPPGYGDPGALLIIPNLKPAADRRFPIPNADDFSRSRPVLHAVEVVDLDGDGLSEILTADNLGVELLRPDGKNLQHWPSTPLDPRRTRRGPQARLQRGPPRQARRRSAIPGHPRPLARDRGGRKPRRTRRFAQVRPPDRDRLDLEGGPCPLGGRRRRRWRRRGLRRIPRRHRRRPVLRLRRQGRPGPGPSSTPPSPPRISEGATSTATARPTWSPSAASRTTSSGTGRSGPRSKELSSSWA